ncbi:MULTISPECIES: hypothetical protein [Rhizobium/Agrobacterium group]|uniref:hypothetical protein n=1 Tax=Rhizobium/Agrobacterium group TaxID=227290 RepID=UPI000FD6F612|nr:MULTISPECIES: hypothetical protein [Rhizobium/Agrobacterium group]MBB4400500.1 hypothetical protein [Agrobacterium radiobacter]MBB5586655.1 hypothetical protein [Agrobacterium radiobacter]RVT79141.1 hypothetical protein EM858_07155 [Agrobacterium sp. CNPSo 2736]
MLRQVWKGRFRFRRRGNQATHTSSIRFWRKAEAQSDIPHQKTLKPITATSEGGLLERMPHFHSSGFTTSGTTALPPQTKNPSRLAPEGL